MTLAHLRPVDQLEQTRGDGLLLRPVAQDVQPRVERRGRAEERINAHRGGHLRGVEEVLGLG